MGKITRVKPVKLITGFIFKDEKYFNQSEIILSRKFGKVDFKSLILPFNYTDYYAKEMGSGLSRAFISFKDLISPRALAAVKVLTNRVEEKISLKGKRLVNIDPGYLDAARLVLASTKDYAHRLYLDRGIFAETTLIFKGHSFKDLEWTYPDYKSKEYLEIFSAIREIFLRQCQSAPHI
jgi:hypothetical protein